MQPNANAGSSTNKGIKSLQNKLNSNSALGGSASPGVHGSANTTGSSSGGQSSA